MYYTNTMTITLKNNTSANQALAILRSRLSAGFAADNAYRRNPSQIMGEALEVIDNTIVLPEDFGCYITEDAESVMHELIQHLAENMGSESFDWDGWDSNDYTDGHFEAAFRNGLLSIKYTYYPSGASANYHCNECGVVVVSEDDYEAGKIYICPECGEVVDLSEQIPVVTETTIHII